MDPRPPFEERTGLVAAELRFNRNVLLAYFLYTTLNGALRKWVFSGGAIEGMLLLVQLVSPIVLAMVLKRERRTFFSFPILPFAVILLALALNPLNHTLFHGVFGFVLHIGFWLCMAMYVQEREAFPIEKLIAPMVIVCGVECLLGILQFGLPSSHFLNRYVSNNNDVTGFAGDMGTRVTGTFSYIAGYGAFLVFYGLFVWALMVEGKRKLPIIYFLVAIGAVAAFMNGGRAIVLPFLVTVAFGFLSYGSFGNKLKAGAVAVLMLVVAMIYNVGGKFTFIEQSYEAFYSRVKYGNESGESSGRVAKTFEAVAGYSGKHPLFGAGLGATYQGAIAKWGRSPEISPKFEEEPERVIMEGGYFLFIVRLFLFAYVISMLRIPVYFSVLILFYIFMFSPLIFNTNQSTFAFFGIMLVDKMYYLKQKRAG